MLVGLIALTWGCAPAPAEPPPPPPPVPAPGSGSVAPPVGVLIQEQVSSGEKVSVTVAEGEFSGPRFVAVIV